MEDFSGIDTWACGILIINMLTLEFPFQHVIDEKEIYENFLSDP
jgi:serine/threonine protein kinase